MSVFGPYILEARLAVGGTAEVYLAHRADPSEPQTRIVVKRLLPDLLADEEARSMFEREAELHTLVRHENVVTVFASGKNAQGEPYLAMEYIEGVDGYRLLRKLRQDRRLLPLGLAAHVAKHVLHALAAAHETRDANGQLLGVIHRDVTPSNIYFSNDGWIKLGDFGIARAASTVRARNAQSVVLKGKFAYLSPEQVASEPFDHRADLFSVGSVLAEMLIGEPLFGGGGQLAVLLAIRDCRLDALTAIRDRLPADFYAVMLRALTRDPDERYQRAQDFADALAPFAPPQSLAMRQLAELVRQTAHTKSTDKFAAVRPTPKVEVEEPVASSIAPSERATSEYTTLPSFVKTARGVEWGPWTFARLVEALATGAVGRGDFVDYMGSGFRAVESTPDLARFLPPASQATREVASPTEAFKTYDLAVVPILEVLLEALERNDTGVLICERTAEGERAASRKELYFVRGRLHHVASSNASELLGQYLVGRGKIAPEELDMALAVLPRYQGRMGDTLISLGLASAVDIFQAIREQGRDRVADVFMWKQGRAQLYPGQLAHHVEFPLDLDLANLVLAGMEAAMPGDTALERYRARMSEKVGPGKGDRPELSAVKWPVSVTMVEALTRTPRTLADLLHEATSSRQSTVGGVLRALEILMACHIVAISK